jgi:hypothetical protein
MSFPPGTEMFQFPGFAFVSYVFRNKYLLLISASPSSGSDQNSELQISKVGFPIRKFTDQRLFAAPRDLSQRTTSFIASQRQGIHRIPLRHLIALIIDAHFSSAAKDLRFIASAIQWARSKRPACFKYTRDVAVMPRPLKKVRARGQSRRSNRMYFLFTMSDNPLAARRPVRSTNAWRSETLVWTMANPAAHRSSRGHKLGRRPLVEPDGIEPTTSCLQSTRSPN